ncbi:response regulator transcription factor [Patescibacteria group bacterium]|nr:response regulator transcription factor [Patescibacteria group bacterium]
MKILIYHTPDKKTEALERICQQSCIYTKSCEDQNQFLQLSGYDSYAATLINTSDRFDQIGELFLAWKKVRKNGACFILTANQSAYERGKILELGADEYYIEPYSYSRLVAEIARYEYSREQEQSNRLVTNHFILDLLSRVAYCDNVALPLSRKEFDLLSFLLRYQGQVLSRVQIWEELWGYQYIPLANSVDVHVNRLRKKIPDSYKGFIKTFHGVGYQLDEQA